MDALNFTLPFVNFEVRIEIVILGLISGIVYGLLAVGLTLIYKANRVINFAHGAMGALPSLVLAELVIKKGMSYWLALPLAVSTGIAAGALLEWGVIRRLRKAPRLLVMIATIAAGQILSVFVILLPKGDAFLRGTYPTPFTTTVTIGSLNLGAGELMVLTIGPVLALGLALFLNRTRIGLAAKASAENAEAALLTGIPVKRVSLLVWTLAGTFAGVATILVSGIQPLNAQQGDLGPSLMVRGLAAAMLGGLEVLPIVFGAGLLMGVVENLISSNYPSAGIITPLLFLVILGSLLFRKGLGQAARGTGAGLGLSLAGGVKALPERLRHHPRVVVGRRISLLVAVALVAGLTAALQPSQQILVSSVLIFATMGLSLTVLTGYAGQASLGQYAFVALGAVVAGRATQIGFPALSALGYAILVCGAVALVIGLPALRVRGLFLAVVTLAFALVTHGWLFKQSWLIKVDGNPSSLTLPRPRWFGVDFTVERNFAWLSLAVLVVLGVGVAHLRTTGLGRAMLAVRDNEPAAATLSLSPRRVKLLAFVLSGMIAGIAGFFYAMLLVNFGRGIGGPGDSISLLIMVILGGATTVTGSILGASFIKGVPYFLGSSAALFTSAIGVLAVLLLFPGGLAGFAFWLRDRVVSRLTSQPIRELGAPSVARSQLPPKPPKQLTVTEPAGQVDAVAGIAIAAHDIVVSYGGIVAVDHVSMHARRGEIVGLLGPNGAGKTTLFDVLSGHQRPSSGRVSLLGEDVTRRRPEDRALLGLGRTFQQARLFDELTVFEAAMISLEREDPTETVPSVLSLPPSRRAERWKRQRAAELLELTGLASYSSRTVSELSTGMRRVLELTCVVGVGAEVILLDEPTAGIAQAEVEQFIPIIREIRDHLDATLVIIEHDIPLMMSLVDRVYVLSAGVVIAEGPPAQVRNDPAVMAAYVGGDVRAVDRSGRRAEASPTRVRTAANGHKAETSKRPLSAAATGSRQQEEA